MSIVLLGSTSGSVTLQEPAIAGSTTIDLPATSGTMAVLPTATSVLPEASGGTGTTTGYYGFKNRIINGAMVIDQRNAGASLTISAGTGVYSLDRWAIQSVAASKLSIQRNAGSVTPPAGFSNYLGATVGASANVTVGASDYYGILQQIEGYNIADLAWGTASAATVTLSFWVRSSLTGTFGGALRNAGTRSYPFTYTISAANTWEQKSITVAGDTSGTWATDNTTGLAVSFGLGYGSTFSGTAGSWASANYISATGAVKLIETNSATFYITGVQLEKGSTATSFDYRPYGTELQLAQRYYWQFPVGVGAYYGSGYCRSAARIDWIVNNPVPMRAAPTLNAVNGTSYFVCEYGGSGSDFFDAVLLNSASVNTVSMYATSGVSVTSASGCLVSSNNSSAVVGYSSEL